MAKVRSIARRIFPADQFAQQNLLDQILVWGPIALALLLAGALIVLSG